MSGAEKAGVAEAGVAKARVAEAHLEAGTPTVQASAAGPATPPGPAIAAVIRFFENIAPGDIPRMGEIYTEDAFFKDPFNEVRGVSAIARIFGHMFDQLHEPRFQVHDALGNDREAFLTWDFVFRRGEQRMCIRGASHLRLDASGRIHFHRDYWDAAEELYAKLPVLGVLMRWLQRRLAS